MIIRNKQKYDHQGNLIESVLLDISWETIRLERNQELQKSDWRFMSDQSPSIEWAEYRKFLRDLPGNFESANDAANAWNEYIIPE